MRSSAVRRDDSSSAADSFATYLKDIGSYSLLTRADEVALAKRIREGDAGALERLVCANLRFVVSVAKKYQRRGVPIADLVNEGNLGLMHAAERFDETRGVKFISFAVWWIRQAILQALAEQGHAVRVPLSRAARVFRLNRRAEALRHELGREPSQQELADRADVGEGELVDTITLARPSLSFDAPVSEGGDANLLDYLADEESTAADADTIEHAMAGSVEDALARLRPREGKVLRLYYGFDGQGPLNLETIGGLLGVTRERARQIKERGLANLRKSERATALATFHNW